MGVSFMYVMLNLYFVGYTFFCIYVCIPPVLTVIYINIVCFSRLNIRLEVWGREHRQRLLQGAPLLTELPLQAARVVRLPPVSISPHSKYEHQQNLSQLFPSDTQIFFCCFPHPQIWFYIHAKSVSENEETTRAGPQIPATCLVLLWLLDNKLKWIWFKF